MSRRLRLWHKKRGGRSTGSRFLGGAAESGFYGILFLIGSASLAQLIIGRMQGDSSHGTFWLWVLVVTSLIVTGAVGFTYSVTRVAASDERRLALARRAKNIELLPQTQSRRLPAIPSADNLTNSPGVILNYRLPVSEVQAWRLPATAAFCLFWNGLLCWVYAVLINQFLAGTVEWLLAGLCLPLTVVSVVSLYHLIRQLLIAAAIGPTSIEVSDHPLQAGGAYEIQLSQTGNTPMQSMEVLLICEEDATYTQGTDTRLERRRVFEQAILRQENFVVEAGNSFEKRCQLQLPENAMHSFQAEHNSIHWKLLVRGVANRWPAFQRVFPLVVFPTHVPSPQEDATEKDARPLVKT